MDNIICNNHITYAEIERYVNASDEDFFQDDKGFFENVDSRIDNCDVCSKRFRAYSFISSMTKAEVLGTFGVTRETLEGFMSYFREKFGNTIKFISNSISIKPMPNYDLGGVKGISEDVKDVCPIIVKPNEKFFEIELSEETSVLINMHDTFGSEKYKLHLWNVTEECIKGEPYIFEETLEEGLLAVATELLEAGKYIVAVVADNG